MFEKDYDPYVRSNSQQLNTNIYWFSTTDIKHYDENMQIKEGLFA
jgi:hypothetical protein